MKWWLVLLCSCLAWPAYADLLDTRLASFAKELHRKDKFTETYTASYLNQPLVSQGELEYQAPGGLIKKIIVPEKINYVIKNNLMTVERGEEVQKVDLTKQPEIGLGINALRDLLEGNRAGLETLFWLSYQLNDSNPEQWELTLIPRERNLLQFVNRVVMRGIGNQLHEVEMQYANGDSLVTRITTHE